jgi:hypothetical protein
MTMPKIFDNVLSFHIQGEIYDDVAASPESIISNYSWTQKDVEGEIHIIGRHKDNRGRINKMIKLSKVHPWIKPKSDLFVQL